MTGPDRAFIAWPHINGAGLAFKTDNGHRHEYIRRDPAVLAALPEVQVMIAAAFEVLCNVLHCCDTEAQAIANRISGPRGERNRCPDGVQVLEDAETIIRAAAALVTPSEATAALEAINRAERNKARREAAAIAGDTDGYRYPTVQAAILATIEPEGGV